MVEISVLQIPFIKQQNATSKDIFPSFLLVLPVSLALSATTQSSGLDWIHSLQMHQCIKTKQLPAEIYDRQRQPTLRIDEHLCSAEKIDSTAASKKKRYTPDAQSSQSSKTLPSPSVSPKFNALHKVLYTGIILVSSNAQMIRTREYIPFVVEIASPKNRSQWI